MTQNVEQPSTELQFHGKLARKTFVLSFLLFLLPFAVFIGITLLLMDPVNWPPAAILISVFFIVGLIIVYIIYKFVGIQVVKPIKTLTATAQSIADGDFDDSIKHDRNDEIGSLAYSIDQAVESILDQNKSISSRLRSLTTQLDLTTELSRATSTSQTIDELIKSFVDLIGNRFNHELAAVFLLDQDGSSAVLKAAAGDSRAAGVFQDFKIHVGSQSFIGWVTDHNEMRLAEDVSSDPLFKPYPNLGEIKSEITIPISLGSNVLGALDIQDTDLDAFPKEEINALQKTTDQLASAIIHLRFVENTRIDPSIVTSLIQASHKVTTSRTFEDVFRTLRDTLNNLPFSSAIFVAGPNEFRPITVKDSQNKLVSARSVNPIPISSFEIADALPETFPISLTGFEKLGGDLPAPLVHACEQLGFKENYLFPLYAGSILAGLLFLGSQDKEPLTPPVLEVITNLIEITIISLANMGTQTTSAVEGDRHVDLSPDRAEREQLLFDITEKIWQAVDIQDVLEITARELTHALNVSRAQIDLSIETETQPNNGISGENQVEEAE